MPVAVHEIPELNQRFFLCDPASFLRPAREPFASAGRHARLIGSQRAPLLLQGAAQLFPDAVNAIFVHADDFPGFTASVCAPANRSVTGLPIWHRHRAGQRQPPFRPRQFSPVAGLW